MGSKQHSEDMCQALAELLQGYPGLLSERVEEVARALMQATLAASEAVGAAREASALQRVRLGRAHSTRAAAAAAQAAQAAQDPAGGGDNGTHVPARTHAPRRRWFNPAHLHELQRAGVVFRKGKFTDAENAAIDAAMAQFAGMHGVGRQQLYAQLFERAGGEAGRRVRRAFWAALGEALPQRQVQALYHHVRRRYHPHNYQGVWTAAEDAALRRLVAAHGPAWEAISRELGRMGTNCRDRWRYMQGALERPAKAPAPE
ncbi:RNA polymerase I enhancer binding protein [Coemansia sp. Benny D115]|nr:RNA polymerase I enhancer binding protein [Coemansia sp. Benny D115]